MMLSEQANERLWDALLKEILIQNCCDELAELEKSVKPHTFSKRFEKNITKMKRRVFGKGRLKAAGVVLRNTAAVVTIVIGLTFGVLLNQPEVSAAVEHVIYHQVTEFFFVDIDFIAILFTLLNTFLLGCIIFIIFLVIKLLYNMVKKYTTKSNDSSEDHTDKQE